MRFDVHVIRCHLVSELIEAPQVREVWHDGSDVVILDLKSGESVSIHMVERYMSLDEIHYIFGENRKSGLYTLLILWGAMFMPSDGQQYRPDDWMRVLLRLYSGKIYAFDAWRDEPYIFPVSFRPSNSHQRFVAHHGGSIHIAQIGIDVAEIADATFRGFWRVAHFDGYNTARATDDFWQEPQANGEPATIRFYMNLLGLKADANREQIKAAYRNMARQHHPDRNPAQDTTNRMQRINDAYRRILRYLDDNETDGATTP